MQRKKEQTWRVEQTATMQDPRSIVKQMKPEQLFAEVRARKLKEI